jgi:hypothetical protein
MRAGFFLAALAATSIAATQTPAAAVAPVVRAQNGQACTVIGTNGNDRLHAVHGRDVVCGLGGNDVLIGGGGNDVLDGGSGNDTLSGGSGADALFGGAGSDKIAGGAGNDKLSGGAGNDAIDGGAGNDMVSGGAGQDRLSGGAGNDVLDGGPGNDVLNGGRGNDRLSGGGGTDKVSGGGGSDTIVEPSPVVTPSPVTPTLPPVPSIEPVRPAPTVAPTPGPTVVPSPAATPTPTPTSTVGPSPTTTPTVAPTVEPSPEPSLPPPPGTPTGLAATAGDGAVSVTWEASPGATTYLVFRGGVQVATVNLPTFTDTGLVNGTAYTYTVQAVDSSAQRSTMSVPATATPMPADNVPPVIDIATVAWTSPLTLDNTTAQTVTLRMRVTDEGTGVAALTAALRSPDNTLALLPLADARRASGTDNDGTWEVTGTLPKTSADGTWQLAQLQATDRVGLSTRYLIAANGTASTPAPAGTVQQPTFRVTTPGYDTMTDDCPFGLFTGTCVIRGTSDRELPIANLNSLRTSWSAAVPISNDQDQTVGFTVGLGDEHSGVADAVGYLTGPDATVIALPGLTPQPVWRRSSGWTMSGVLPAGAATGQWWLSSLRFTDGVGHVQVVTFRPDGSYTTKDGLSYGQPVISPLTVTGTPQA